MISVELAWRFHLEPRPMLYSTTHIYHSIRLVLSMYHHPHHLRHAMSTRQPVATDARPRTRWKRQPSHGSTLLTCLVCLACQSCILMTCMRCTCLAYFVHLTHGKRMPQCRSKLICTRIKTNPCSIRALSLGSQPCIMPPEALRLPWYHLGSKGGAMRV